MSARVAIIERCGQCEHYDSPRVCLHPQTSAGRVLPEANIPPDWCPLTPAAEVGRLRPLEWLDVSRQEPLASKHFVNEHAYAVKQYPWGEYAYWDREDNCWRECGSMEDGKARSEAHYRSRMFAGPLVQIGGGK